MKSFVEAEAYPGTSLILAYAPCIEHKIILPRGLSRLADEMKKAVDSGYKRITTLKNAGLLAYRYRCRYRYKIQIQDTDTGYRYNKIQDKIGH